MIDSENKGSPESSPLSANPVHTLNDDPLLQLLIERWPLLTAEMKRAVIKLAEGGG